MDIDMTSARRKGIRTLKRLVQQNGDKDAILALLERSVRFKHRRLALIRFLYATKLGAEINQDIRSYCIGIASTYSSQDFRKILHQVDHTTLSLTYPCA